jgi:acetolactate synthase-1/2/3 large subunit
MKDGEKVMVAEAWLAALSANGIRHVFANAGTDFAPIIEAVVRANDERVAVPEFVTVPHETVAMGMAQGYYKVSGRMAAAMVHVTVGTANASCGFINASRDSVPLLLAAGRTPLTETGFGARNVSIHWAQESYDQAAGLREYAKWEYEIRAGQPVEALVDRALDIAMTSPRGPVYMTLPREVLAGETEAVNRPDRTPGSMPAAPSAEAIDRVAAAIAKAEFPLMIYSTAHQDPATFHALGALAEAHGIAVCDHIGGAMASGHPMNLGDLRGMKQDFVKMADLLLVVDAGVPWVPKFVQPQDGATVIQIAPDPHFSSLPFRGFRADMAIAGEPSLAVALLHETPPATRRGPKRGARRSLRPAPRWMKSGPPCWNAPAP